MNLNITY